MIWTISVLKYLQIFFYICSVSLWFKHRFPELRNFPLTYHIPLVLFIGITLLRFFPWYARKSRRYQFRIKLSKNLLIFLGLAILAVSFRIPYVAHHQGLTDGDDGLIILQAKHISEGDPPSIHNYGVIHEGSTVMHVYALLFKLFGYSIPVLRITALCLFLGFIAVQFILLREIFSQELAVLVCLFYCLPIGHTLVASLNLSGDFPSILFLGSLMVYLVYLITVRRKETLIPVLGFIMGLAFWMHQMTVSFILSCLVIFAMKYGYNIKKYLKLAAFAVIGGFPLVLNEIMTKFSLSRFLLPGKSGQMDFFSQVKRSFEILTYLLSREINPIRYFFMGLLFLTLGGFFIVWIKKKKLFPYGVYPLFFSLFFVIYFLSKFSSGPILSVRYYYPLYFVLPVFLLASVLLIRSWGRYFLGGAILSTLLIFGNIKGFSEDLRLVKQAHKNLTKAVTAMESTGEKYWVGDFWDSFLITAVSGERIISYENAELGHFPPYALYYHNDGNNNNFLFLNEVGIYTLGYKEMLDNIAVNLTNKMERAQKLLQFLEKFCIGFQKKEIGKNLLIYSIKEDIPVRILSYDLPEEIPEFRVVGIEASRGLLTLTLENKHKMSDPGFSLHAEIPEFSAFVRRVPQDKMKFTVLLPYSGDTAVKVRFYLDYCGIKIPNSLWEYPCPPLKTVIGEKRRQIIYLSGLGPYVKVREKRYRVCDKEVRIEVNPPPDPNATVSLSLYSPFDFSDPIWYRDFAQEVQIEVNGIHYENRLLVFGKNLFRISGTQIPWHIDKSNIVVLKFRYHFPFRFMSYRKTAALLENVTIH